jgi:hypothetical protein
MEICLDNNPDTSNTTYWNRQTLNKEIYLRINGWSGTKVAVQNVNGQKPYDWGWSDGYDVGYTAGQSASPSLDISSTCKNTAEGYYQIKIFNGSKEVDCWYLHIYFSDGSFTYTR